VNNDSLVEYQIILNVYLPQNGGRTIKQVVRASDRSVAIEKFKYLGRMVTEKKNATELRDWCAENLQQPGAIVTGTDGLFAVAYLKILP
jgi:hypothetical protein